MNKIKKRPRKIFGTLQRPRIVVSKSNSYLTAQAIDDSSQKTLAYLCTKDLKFDSDVKNKKSIKFSSFLALEFSKILIEKNFNEVVFDRNGYKYHGKIKKFCEEMKKSKIRC
jgi:large subunit ribosomal protein L18